MDGSSLEDRLAESLSQDPRVLLAFLFGSQARGYARQGSDVDVAVYLDPQLDWDEEALCRVAGELYGRLVDAVSREVDVVVLNTAPPGLAATALRGKRLLIRDERLFLELLCEKTREAEDFQEWLFDFWRLRHRYRKETQHGPTTTESAGEHYQAH